MDGRMRRTLAVIVLMILAGQVSARERIQCLGRKGSPAYHSWRIVDGRRCLFEGHIWPDKKLLYWKQNDGLRGNGARRNDHDGNRNADPVRARGSGPAETPLATEAPPWWHDWEPVKGWRRDK
jgi:hypothetical protein